MWYGLCGCSTASVPADAPGELAAGQPVASKSGERPPEPEAVAQSESVDLARARKIVAADDRTEDDRKTDERRKPAETLAFLQLQPGMHVADIGAGFGYTTELLARAVGPTGKVYGQNPAYVLEKFAEKPWSERLQKPVMARVTRLDREFGDPFPDDLQNTLDRVINVLFYHDFVWMEIDRAAHNRDIFAALKPGGLYVIIDHSSAEGAGTTVTKSLHRIEEKVLRAEVEAAGFVLVETEDFLRNPADTRDFNALPWRGEGGEKLSDKFVLKYKKPDPGSP